MQVPVPVHAPDQPENVDSGPGVAVSSTVVCEKTVSEQSVGQVIPGPLTEPLPVPDKLTVSVRNSSREEFSKKEAKVFSPGPFPVVVK